MNEASRFLGSFGRAISAAALYAREHPTLQKAVAATWHDLEALLAVAPRPTFTFLGECVVYGDRPLEDRRGWEWSERLASVGVQRVQFERSMGPEMFEAFLRDICARLQGREEQPVAPGAVGTGGVRFGAVGLRGDESPHDAPLLTATLAFALDAEIDTASWVHDEVAGNHPIPLLEVEAIVRSLSIAMHASPQMMLPLVDLKEFDQYTTTHSLNVSVLAMGLAERLGVEDRDLRMLGMAGLLHDIGKTLIPRDILNKPGRLTAEERAVVERHPAEGARLILRSDDSLDLCAIIAYEHHIMLDGGGYPSVRFPRACHQASRLVHVCDIFDALRTERPYRAALSSEQAIAHLRQEAGTALDPGIVEAFVAMLEQCGAPSAAAGPQASDHS